MNTRLSYKTIVFVCLAVLTFSIAGIHARVKSVESNNVAKELKEPLPAINTVTITKDVQNPIQKDIPEAKAVNEPDKLQSIPNAETTPQKELLDIQKQENKEPVMVMASINTNAKNKIEMPIDIVDVRSSEEPVLIKDQAETIVLTQNETAENQGPNEATIPDNAIQNVRPEEAANDSKKEDIDTAIAEITRQIELNDSDAGLYVLRGNLHMDKQAYEQAVNDYTKAIKINPDDVAAYNNRGLAYANMEEHKQAIKDYNKAVKIDSNNISAYINRGNAYHARNKYLKAISDYTRAIEIDPEISLAYINRGITYFREKSFSNAINDFSKALELDNRGAGTYLLRSNAYNSIGEYMQAINDCSKALEINPDFIDAYNNRGMAYEGMGELDKAELEYSKAIELASKDPDAYFNRKLISTQKARTNIAGRANPPMKFIRNGGLYPYDDYKDRFPTIADGFSSLWEFSDPFMNRFRLYIKTGQFDKAANNFKTIENFMMGTQLEYEKNNHTAKQSKPDYTLIEAEAKKEYEDLMRTRIQSNTQFDSTFEVIEENRRRLGY